LHFKRAFWRKGDCFGLYRYLWFRLATADMGEKSSWLFYSIWEPPIIDLHNMLNKSKPQIQPVSTWFFNDGINIRMLSQWTYAHKNMLIQCTIVRQPVAIGLWVLLNNISVEQTNNPITAGRLTILGWINTFCSTLWV
jgi:predicted secreted Zn-dependent protease